MKKIYRYGLLAVAIAFMGYHSVYFKKLSEVNRQKKAAFDFNAFADSLYYKGILKSDDAIELSSLLALVQTNPDSAFEAYGNMLGIGNSAYFLVKSNGRITDVTDNQLQVVTTRSGIVNIDTKYIFGNALRDASGLVKLTDFKTTTDFNKVSESLNTLIREKVIPPIVGQLKKGDEINFTGALKLNKKQLENPQLIIIPAQINGGQ